MQCGRTLIPPAQGVEPVNMIDMITMMDMSGYSGYRYLRTAFEGNGNSCSKPYK